MAPQMGIVSVNGKQSSLFPLTSDQLYRLQTRVYRRLLYVSDVLLRFVLHHH